MIIQENAFENVVLEKAAILSQSQCVKMLHDTCVGLSLTFVGAIHVHHCVMVCEAGAFSHGDVSSQPKTILADHVKTGLINFAFLLVIIAFNPPVYLYI